MKRKSFVIILFLVTGAICACNRGEETKGTGTQTPTAVITEAPTETPDNNGEQLSATITPTVTPTSAPLPAATAAPEGERIPIDEAHFTSAVFREYISERYDTDKDGYLSEPERDAVLEIYIEYYKKEFDEECLDGFEFFPNLVSLDVACAKEVILQNHSNVKYFGGTEGGINTVRIENCPALTNIGFYSFGISSLYISNVAPRASFGLGGHCLLNDVVLDADIMIEIEDNGMPFFTAVEDDLYYESSFYYYDENGKGTYGWNRALVEFINQNESYLPVSEQRWKEYLEKAEPDFYQVQILEKAEDIYNAQGQKGYNVCVEIKDYEGTGLTFTGKLSKVSFPLYADETPTTEQIVFRPVQIHKIRGLEYSPNRGASMMTTWDLNVLYRNGEEEQVIGVLEGKTHYCTINTEGSVKVYPALMSWNKGKFAGKGQDSANILIDGEHFSSEMFRQYIESNYNTDYYEGLTIEEQEAVVVMDLSGFIRFHGETLDGFEHFPKLKELYLGNTGALIIENHPSLQVIGGKATGLKKLIIRNCPELERLDLDLSAVEEVVIEGCGKLK